MLRARAASSLVRVVYSDLILGLYTDEEAREIPVEAAPSQPPLKKIPDSYKPLDAPRPEIPAPPVNESPSQRKAAQPEKPQRSPESAALFAKVSSAIKASLDESQIAMLKEEHGPLTKLSDEQLGQVYAQVEAINAAKSEVEPGGVEGDPFASGAE